MSDRKISHPTFPDVVKTVKASDAKKWEAAGWVPTDAPKSPVVQKHAAKKRTTKKSTSDEGSPALKVNHQHD